MDSLTLERHNSFQNQNNRKATKSFAPRPLIFKLEREVLNFNDTCVSWSFPSGYERYETEVTKPKYAKCDHTSRY